MTKILKSALVALLVTSCCVMKAETIEYTTDEGFSYRLDTENKEASLYKYSGATKEVVVPESVTYEGNNYNVTSLGDRCFSNCASLTSVEIPSSVTSLGGYCFADCSSLKSIVVDANNPVYDSREGCNAIIETKSNTMIAGCKSTRIPESVTSLGGRCFIGCTSLTSIEIPESVTSLGNECFSNCVSLTSIKIPSSVTSLGDGCFFACLSLTSVEIPPSVTSLGDGCFFACLSLTSVEIPPSVTSLGRSCFDGCSSLTSVVSKIEEPFKITKDSYTFDDRQGCTLTVPYGTKDAYITAGWDIFFADIIEEGVVELDEDSEESPVEEKNTKVCVKRNINAGEWSTIVLPFNMSEEQVKKAFGKDVQLADFAGYETVKEEGKVTGIQVNFNASTSISANRPCLIKVSMDISEFTVEGVDVVPVEMPLVEAVPSTESQWSKMVGSYVAGTQVKKNCLFLSGNKFWYSTGATKMKGYRAYFDFSDILSSVENAEAKVRLAINGDGTTTGVESMEFSARKEAGSWYSLGGRRLTGKPTEKGIYIVNGKKVAID